MPRYFFNVDDAAGPDAEGVELDNLAAAKCEAVKTAGTIICDSSDTFWDTQEWAMTVTDHTGLSLLTLQFIGSEAPAVRKAF